MLKQLDALIAEWRKPQTLPQDFADRMVAAALESCAAELEALVKEEREGRAHEAAILAAERADDARWGRS